MQNYDRIDVGASVVSESPWRHALWSEGGGGGYDVGHCLGRPSVGYSGGRCESPLCLRLVARDTNMRSEKNISCGSRAGVAPVPSVCRGNRDSWTGAASVSFVCLWSHNSWNDAVVEQTAASSPAGACCVDAAADVANFVVVSKKQRCVE